MGAWRGGQTENQEDTRSCTSKDLYPSVATVLITLLIHVSFHCNGEIWGWFHEALLR